METTSRGSESPRNELAEATPSLSLPGSIDLLRSSYRFFKENWSFLWQLVLIQFVLAAGINIAAMRGPEQGMLAILIYLVIGIVQALTMTAYMFAITKGERDLLSSYIGGARLILPLVWIGVLQFFLMAGIVLTFVIPASFVDRLWVLYIFGFVLIIPVVALSLFSNYELFADNKRGISAIAASWASVRPRFWSVLARLVGFGMAMIIAIIPVVFIRLILPDIGDEIVNAALSALLQPFNLIFVFLLYKAMKGIPEQAVEPFVEGSIKKYLGWVMLFGLALVILFVAMFGYMMITDRNAEDATSLQTFGAPVLASVLLMMNLLR